LIVATSRGFTAEAEGAGGGGGGGGGGGATNVVVSSFIGKASVNIRGIRTTTMMTTACKMKEIAVIPPRWLAIVLFESRRVCSNMQNLPYLKVCKALCPVRRTQRAPSFRSRTATSSSRHWMITVPRRGCKCIVRRDRKS